MRHYVFRGLAALALSFSVLAPAAQAQTATLTITTDGPNSGAVGVQGPNGNVCNPNPGGGGGGGTCVFTYPVNTALRIAANSPNPAPPGFIHGGTGDAAACGTSTCNLVINTDSSIIVTFDASQGPIAAITTTLLGDGKGNVGEDNNQCQNFELGFSACTTYYAMNSEVRLQGRSMPGNIFASFSGGAGDTSVCGANSLCTFTATGNSAVNATFSALASVAVEPPASTVSVGLNAFFNARATFTNGMTRFGFSGNSPWFSHVPMDTARYALAAATVNDRLYAVGGVDAFGPLGTVEVFDPTITAIADFPLVWSPRASMPTPRESLAAAVVNGKIYALGGRTSGGVAVPSMESYDPATNVWSPLAPMSAARAGMAAAVIGNTIYAVGGHAIAGVPLTTVEAYDVLTGIWTPRAPMSVARTGAGAAAVNGILYVMSGDAGGSVEAFDPATGTWTSKTSMPGGGGMHKAVALNGLIYAVGGPSATVKVYNPATDSWLTLNNMPSPLSEFGLAVLDGRLFAAGGLSGTSAVATFNAHRPPETTWWSSNSAVGRVNSGNNGSVQGMSVGTATISAQLVAIPSGASSATLTVTSGNVSPSQIFVNLPNEAFTDVGNPNWGCGTFNQNNASGPYTVTVNYGEPGGVNENLPFTPNPPPNSPCVGSSSPKGVFFFNHAYSSAGTFHVTVTVRNTSTNQTTTGGFNVQVQDNGGGGGEDCAQVISNITAIGAVPFDRVQVKVFDRTTNDLLFEGELPIGFFDEAGLPAGQFRIEFSVPAGYMVTPSTFNVDVDEACGQVVHLDATVQAIPAVPPAITLQLSPDSIWPPNNKMVTVTATITASSPNGHATTVELVSITNNETGAADVAGAAFGTDDRTFELRAQRAGGGSGRTYTITYRATDTVTGLSTLVSATVFVPHDQGK